MPRTIGVRRPASNGYVYIYDTGAKIRDSQGQPTGLRIAKVGMCGQNPELDRGEEGAWLLLLANLARARHLLKNFNRRIDLPRGSAHSIGIVARSKEKFQQAKILEEQHAPKAMGRPAMDWSGIVTESDLKRSITDGKFKNFTACVRCTTHVYALESEVRQLIGTSMPIDIADEVLSPPPRYTQGLSEYVLVPKRTLVKLKRRYIQGQLSSESIVMILRKYRNNSKLKKPKVLEVRAPQKTAITPPMLYLEYDDTSSHTHFD